MSQTLTVELSDTAFAALRHEAETVGTSPADLAAVAIERRYGSPPAHGSPGAPPDQDARERFRRHFGEVDIGRPTGADNESIDADLAREYADSHEAG
jgi:hypothetical protein